MTILRYLLVVLLVITAGATTAGTAWAGIPAGDLHSDVPYAPPVRHTQPQHRHHPTKCGVTHRHHRVKHHHCTRTHHPVRPAAHTQSLPQPGPNYSNSNTSPTIPIGMGDVPGCADSSQSPVPYLQSLHGATLMRVIVNPWIGTGALGCVQQARAAGYRVAIDVQWWNDDGPTFAQDMIQAYGPYAWELSLGNEQELQQNNAVESPDQYSAMWKALLPSVRAYAPNAILGGGEISPWGWNWLQQALADGLPGIQVIASHPYPFSGPNGFDVPSFVNWIHSQGLSAWFTESLCGPGDWYQGDCWSNAATAQLGAQVAFEWHG